MIKLIFLAIMLIAVFAFAFQTNSHATSLKGLRTSELSKIRSVNDAYVSAWLRNDAEAVMGLFTQDAVLIPQGNRPIKGHEAMRKFWWPAGPPTTITSFTITTDEVDGNESLAYVRGSFTLGFSFEDNGKTVDRINRGNYFMIMKRQSNGRWLISHRMWSDLPR